MNLCRMTQIPAAKLVNHCQLAKQFLDPSSFGFTLATKRFEKKQTLTKTSGIDDIINKTKHIKLYIGHD